MHFWEALARLCRHPLGLPIMAEAVLSDKKILEEIHKGNIVIHPFDESSLGNCSYDVRLGPYYYRADKTLGVLNPWCKEHIKAYWGEPLKATRPETPEDARRLGLRQDQAYILLQPGETILGHTLEYIGGQNTITTMMKTRSSLRRSGISCCMCAGWGDVGYVNRWTMEITNHAGVPVVLPVGARVAQIVFLYTGEVTTSYHGKYQTKDWMPECMLPLLYKE